MSTKFFFLLFGALLLVQCVTSNSSEETSKDNSNDSSEEKIDEDHLKRHVTKLYLKLLDQTVAATKRTFEPLIKDMQNNKGTTNTNVRLLLTELEKVLEKANTKSTTTNLDDEKRKKNHVLGEILDITRDLEKIKDENKTPTEQDENVRKGYKTIINDLSKNIETFVDQTVQEIEKFWKGLSATEQKEKQTLHETFNKVENKPAAREKFAILDKEFNLSEVTAKNTVAS